MTLTELRYIVALAQTRHFGKAAERCFVSQPTLSVAIRKLEEELGVVLFERGGGEILPTPIGARIVEQAERVMQEAGRIKALAEQGKDPLNGPLALGIIYTIAPALLPPLLPRLREVAPNMPLLIRENFTGRLAESLRRGDIDVAILSPPFREAGVMLQPLYDEPFRVAIPANHPWQAATRIDPARLADESVLLLGTGNCFRDQVLQVCPALARSSTGDDLQRTLEGTSLATIRQMVAYGVGITVLPALSAQSNQGEAGLISFRDFTAPLPQRQVALAWRKSFPRRAAIEALRQAVLACELPGCRKLDMPAVDADA